MVDLKNEKGNDFGKQLPMTRLSGAAFQGDSSNVDVALRCFWNDKSRAFCSALKSLISLDIVGCGGRI